jgi:hypothetical protein
LVGATMTIKYIFTEMIEAIIKLFIVACFLLSTAMFIFIFVPSHRIDFWKIDTCTDIGGGWDREKRLCLLWLDIR